MDVIFILLFSVNTDSFCLVQDVRFPTNSVVDIFKIYIFGFREVSPIEVSPIEVSPIEVSPSEVSPSEVSPSEVSPSEVSPSEVSPIEVSVILGIKLPNL